MVKIIKSRLSNRKFPKLDMRGSILLSSIHFYFLYWVGWGNTEYVQFLTNPIPKKPELMLPVGW